MSFISGRNNIYCLLLSLLPILLITGPFLTDLLIFLLGASFFFVVREKRYYLNHFSIFFSLFCIIILICSFFSKHVLLSLESSLFFLRFGLFSLFFWFLIENKNDLLKWLLNILLFCFIVLFFDSILQFFTGFNFFFMEIIEKNRISSFFGDELKMGGYLSKLFPLLIALLFHVFSKKNDFKLIFIGFFVILITQILIYLSGERTSFFLFNFSLILFLIFINNYIKVKSYFLIIFFIFSTFLLSIETPYKQRLIDLTINQLFLDKGDSKYHIFSDQYQEHYLSSWKMFKDNKLLGIGPKNFRERCKEEKYNFSELTCSTHPHNIPLQLLAETGVAGFTIYFMFLMVIFYFLIRSLIFKLVYKKFILDNFQISILICITVCFWPLAPSGNFFNNWNSAINFMPIGMLLWSFRNNIKNSSHFKLLRQNL